MLQGPEGPFEAVKRGLLGLITEKVRGASAVEQRAALRLLNNMAFHPVAADLMDHIGREYRCTSA